MSWNAPQSARGQEVRRKTIEMMLRVLDDTIHNAEAIMSDAAELKGISFSDVDMATVKSTVREMRGAMEALLAGGN